MCQVSRYYLERHLSYGADKISILKITKGNNSIKNVGGVTIVNLCMLSSHALYLCQISFWIKELMSYVGCFFGECNCADWSWSSHGTRYLFIVNHAPD